MGCNATTNTKDPDKNKSPPDLPHPEEKKPSNDPVDPPVNAEPNNNSPDPAVVVKKPTINKNLTSSIGEVRPNPLTLRPTSPRKDAPAELGAEESKKQPSIEMVPEQKEKEGEKKDKAPLSKKPTIESKLPGADDGATKDNSVNKRQSLQGGDLRKKGTVGSNTKKEIDDGAEVCEEVSKEGESRKVARDEGRKKIVIKA